MDKQSTFGFILIGLVLIVWMWLQAPSPQPAPPQASDSLRTARQAPAETTRVQQPQPSRHATPALPAELGEYFAGKGAGAEKIIVVKTDLYTAQLSTRGGAVKTWELSKYRTWDGAPVQLVDYDHGGDLSLLFTSSDGKLINTHNLFFDADPMPWSSVTLAGDQTTQVTFRLVLAGGRQIVKRYTFANGRYDF